MNQLNLMPLASPVKLSTIIFALPDEQRATDPALFRRHLSQLETTRFNDPNYFPRCRFGMNSALEAVDLI